MLLSQVAGALKARILTGSERAATLEVDRLVVSSAMSELLALARPGVLPVTDLDSAQVVGALVLLDVECLGLTMAQPSAQVVAAARRTGIVLLACSQALSGVNRTALELGLPCAGHGVERV